MRNQVAVPDQPDDSHRSLEPHGHLGASISDAYRELRRLAQCYLGSERFDHTLQATALVHEAYLRLSGRPRGRWRGRDHFFKVAAREMRRVLIDHARRHQADRRGQGSRGVALTGEIENRAAMLDPQLLELSDALNALATLDRRKAEVVELRYFGGLTIDETADLLGLSPVTIVREWRLARAWLYRELKVGSR